MLDITEKTKLKILESVSAVSSCCLKSILISILHVLGPDIVKTYMFTSTALCYNCETQHTNLPLYNLNF